MPSLPPGAEPSLVAHCERLAPRASRPVIAFSLAAQSFLSPSAPWETSVTVTGPRWQGGAQREAWMYEGIPVPEPFGTHF